MIVVVVVAAVVVVLPPLVTAVVVVVVLVGIVDLGRACCCVCLEEDCLVSADRRRVVTSTCTRCVCSIYKDSRSRFAQIWLALKVWAAQLPAQLCRQNRAPAWGRPSSQGIASASLTPSEAVCRKLRKQ